MEPSIECSELKKRMEEARADFQTIRDMLGDVAILEDKDDEAVLEAIDEVCRQRIKILSAPAQANERNA